MVIDTGEIELLERQSPQPVNRRVHRDSPRGKFPEQIAERLVMQ